ncbi:MAG: N-acetylmuramoyl-L-alanine amidase [Ruminiclostridium sp.]|nr:N-acetylmuramoyl-L-alanine amidase [Ruminiclostridium sp.]
MEIKRNLKEKIPFITVMACCCAVLAISGVAKKTETSESAMATAGEKQVVIIDPGHGGPDGGGVGVNGAIEKDINLDISKYLGTLLNMSGYEVVYTRTEDISIYDDGITGLRNQKISDMENRLEIVEQYPDSIFLSIHQNQYTDSAYFGGQMFYTTNNSGNFRLATIMQEKFAELQQGNDREVKLIDNGLYLFKNTKQPALLIECGFLSNPADAEKLSNPEYQKKVAFTIYRGLAEYLKEVKNKENTENYGETESFLYMQ